MPEMRMQNTPMDQVRHVVQQAVEGDKRLNLRTLSRQLKKMMPIFISLSTGGHPDSFQRMCVTGLPIY